MATLLEVVNNLADIKSARRVRFASELTFRSVGVVITLMSAKRFLFCVGFSVIALLIYLPTLSMASGEAEMASLGRAERRAITPGIFAL